MTDGKTQAGCCSTNCQCGRHKSPTPEHRAKISAALRGRKRSPEHAAKLSAAMKGKTPPPEHIAKIMAGRRLADARRVATIMQSAPPCEVCGDPAKRIKGSHFYKTCGSSSCKREIYVRAMASPEVRAKISAAVKASDNHPPGWSEKISAALKGKKHSPSAVARMTATKRASNVEPNYFDIHHWARHDLPLGCALADGSCLDRLEAAFRYDAPAEFVRTDELGRPYSIRVEDYWRLCATHHRRFDMEQAA
jgi:hypothetical protein